MGSQDRLEKMQLRQNYRNLWHTDLMRTVQHDPPYCCLAFWCGPCVSYMLRKRALYNDMSRYVCCAGYLPCSGRCGESRCPEFCLATEVLLCFGNSVASTRFLLQDEFNIQTTQCDNCIIGFMFCLQQVACIFSIVAMIVGSSELSEASQILSCLADMVYCTHNTRLKWTSAMASLAPSRLWQFPRSSKCRDLISHTPRLLDTLLLMGSQFTLLLLSMATLLPATRGDR
ncbi:uncharacterized protein LOC127255929 isoform X2 [Andrographis paniculata]|uniref:uncharacterized protein LOC127255929 isoform X2 n=1 Tax=Andrographis paniculata TaxID=175694 RepID=UPI0021E7B7A5|nr:uncharacterized protein LOC127255929 isoform X2 [Andrographis paniculata]